MIPNKKIRQMLAAVAFGTLAFTFGVTTASANPDAPSVKQVLAQTPNVQARYAIQISDANPFKRKMVLKVAKNLLKKYGPKNVDIEIVAFGPGLELLYKDNNPYAKKIAKLASQGVRFSACHNTIKHLTKVLGHPPVLVPQARVVAGGMFRLYNLFKAGYFIDKP